MRLKFFLVFFIALFILAGASFLSAQTTGGPVVDNLPITGYAWSSNIGWISFSSLNCDSVDQGGGSPPDGLADPSPPAPLGCPSEGTAISPYNTFIDSKTGDLSGYAWSPNLGWLSVNRSEVGDPPLEDIAGLNPPLARLNLKTNILSGWARFCSVFESGCSGAMRDNLQRGGWNGWVRMAGTGYAVERTSNNLLQSFAWGSDHVVGWVRFLGTVPTHQTILPTPKPFTVKLTPSPTSGRAPLKVNMTAEVFNNADTSLYALTYNFNCENGGPEQIVTSVNAIHTVQCIYSKAGNYKPTVLIEQASLGTTSTTANIRVGILPGGPIERPPN